MDGDKKKTMKHFDAMTYQHILDDGYEISQTMTRVIAKIATEVANRGEISIKIFSDKVGIPYGNVRVYKSRYKFPIDKTQV